MIWEYFKREGALILCSLIIIMFKYWGMELVTNPKLGSFIVTVSDTMIVFIYFMGILYLSVRTFEDQMMQEMIECEDEEEEIYKKHSKGGF